jgi:hypothetical protein
VPWHRIVARSSRFMLRYVTTTWVIQGSNSTRTARRSGLRDHGATSTTFPIDVCPWPPDPENSGRYSELANSSARCTSSSPESGIWPVSSASASRQSGCRAMAAPVLVEPPRPRWRHGGVPSSNPEGSDGPHLAEDDFQSWSDDCGPQQLRLRPHSQLADAVAPSSCAEIQICGLGAGGLYVVRMRRGQLPR